MQSAGAQVRIELRAESGETMQVEMPQRRFQDAAFLQARRNLPLGADSRRAGEILGLAVESGAPRFDGQAGAA